MKCDWNLFPFSLQEIRKIISGASEIFNLLQVIELALWSGWLVIPRCNLFRRVWLVDLYEVTESDKVLSWNLKGMPARFYLGFNEWINEGKAIEIRKPPLFIKWSMPFLRFILLNSCTPSFPVCMFIWEGHTQGILVSFLLDKTILEDETHNIQAALQAHKTWDTSWRRKCLSLVLLIS